MTPGNIIIWCFLAVIAVGAIFELFERPKTKVKRGGRLGRIYRRQWKREHRAEAREVVHEDPQRELEFETNL